MLNKFFLFIILSLLIVDVQCVSFTSQIKSKQIGNNNSSPLLSRLFPYKVSNILTRLKEKTERISEQTIIEATATETIIAEATTTTTTTTTAIPIATLQINNAEMPSTTPEFHIIGPEPARPDVPTSTQNP